MFIKITKSGLATAITILFTVSLLLSFAVTRTNAEGPLGTPPTGNVSPTFSDVNIQGQLKTNRTGYDNLDSTSLGVAIKSKTGDGGLTKFKQALQAFKPLFIDNYLLVSGEIVAVTAKLYGSLYVEGYIDVNGQINADDVTTPSLKATDIYTAVEPQLDADGKPFGSIVVPVTVKAYGGLKVEKDFVVGDTSDTSVKVSTSNSKDTIDIDAGGKHLRLLSKAGKVNIGDPSINNIPDDITLWGKGINVISDTKPINVNTNGQPLNISGGTVDLYGNTIKIQSAGGTTFSGTTKFLGQIGGDLNINGHLKAKSIGKVEGRTDKVTIKPKATKTLTIACQANEIPLSATYLFNDTFYTSPVVWLWGFLATETKTNYSNVNKDLVLYIYCLDPDA